MAADGEIAVRVRIRGRVQGVAYRYWTVEAAGDRGLRGWVRNRRDGSVEALFVGVPELVEDMIDACRQGPPAAHVTGIEREAAEDPGASGFRQLPTL
jgi:acylphosphatase